MSSRPSWSTEQVPGQPWLHSNTLSQNKNNKQTNKTGAFNIYQRAIPAWWWALHGKLEINPYSSPPWLSGQNPSRKAFSVFSQNTIMLLFLFFDSGLFWSVFLLAFRVLDVSQGRLKSTWIWWQQLGFRKLPKRIHCLKKYFPNRVLNRKQDCTVVKSSGVRTTEPEALEAEL